MATSVSKLTDHVIVIGTLRSIPSVRDLPDVVLVGPHFAFPFQTLVIVDARSDRGTDAVMVDIQTLVAADNEAWQAELERN
jgi:hypothetical protein